MPMVRGGGDFYQAPILVTADPGAYITPWQVSHLKRKERSSEKSLISCRNYSILW